MHLRRALIPTVAAAAAACVTAAVPSSAAGLKPQIKDPAGDVLVPQPAYDIVSAGFDTRGITTTKKVKGKRVRTYKPVDLVVTLTMAAPPSEQTGFGYFVNADAGDCTGITWSYVPGQPTPVGSLYIPCGDTVDPTTGTSGDFVDAGPEVKGNSLVFTYPISALPSKLKLGTVLTGLSAHTEVVDPVFGLFGSNLVGAPLDEAQTSAAYRIG